MNKTILVIENSEDLQELVSLILMMHGFNVKSLNPSQVTLSIIQELKPCAIILDIVRITEDGTLLCRSIKKDEQLKETPLIVLSTHPKSGHNPNNLC